MNSKAFILAVGLLLVGCGGEKQQGQPTTRKADANTVRPGADSSAIPLPLPTTSPVLRADGKVREPAVSGLWYPSDPQQLARMVDTLLTAAIAGVPGKVRGMIVPHAGYPFSGITAAVAYKQLMGQDIETVIVMASSHTAAFDGASIPSFEAYRTPLGLVPLSPKAAALAKVPPFHPAQPTRVRRISDDQLKSKLPPPPGQETPHTWEHTIEAQLPFLQWSVRRFQLVPILFGQVDPQAVASALTGQIDDKTLLVVSSDLSHYHDYDTAKSLDAWCVQAVRDMDLKLMAQQEACGKDPILTLMQIAKERGWKPNILDYRNSGDTAKGDKSRVVGYMAVVFTEGGQAAPEPLTEAEQKYLLKIARDIITAAVQKGPLPPFDQASLTPKLRTPRGAFVTLSKGGKLRGCIGYTLAIKPLFLTVMETAANAALRDQRFQPVQPEELKDIDVDISVLTLPTPIYYNTPSDLLKRLRPKIDGVVLQVPVVVQDRQTLATSVYLPAVWEEIPDPEKFMDQLSIKAGLPANAWRQPAARILTFQAEEFQEARKAPAPPATQPAPAPQPAPATRGAKE